MYFMDLVFALAFGWFIVWIVSSAFGTKGPWGSLVWFFVAVSIFAWAGGVWIVPFGPTWGGIGWFPIIFMGLIASLLLTSASPRKPRRRKVIAEEVRPEEEAKVVVDAIFWVIIICLLILGFGGYFWIPRIG